MTDRWVGRDLLSVDDLDRQKIEEVLHRAKQCALGVDGELLKGVVLGSCFFEPSTRTRLSFETAMVRLGGSVVGFSEAGTTSSKKGESLSDMMRVIGDFVDVVVIRHPEIGSAREAAIASRAPVINAGDGAGEHPTQTLVDLFTIWEIHGKVDGLKIALVGDLKHGRTVHSLIKALLLFNVEFFLVAPSELALEESEEKKLKKLGVKFYPGSELEEIIREVDILYMTRLQKERLQQEMAQNYCLKKEMLVGCKPHLSILHPLPRLGEIDREIDETPFAKYFEQAKNGVFVRMALFYKLFTEN